MRLVGGHPQNLVIVFIQLNLRNPNAKKTQFDMLKSANQLSTRTTIHILSLLRFTTHLGWLKQLPKTKVEINYSSRFQHITVDKSKEQWMKCQTIATGPKTQKWSCSFHIIKKKVVAPSPNKYATTGNQHPSFVRMHLHSASVTTPTLSTLSWILFAFFFVRLGHHNGWTASPHCGIRRIARSKKESQASSNLSIITVRSTNWTIDARHPWFAS